MSKVSLGVTVGWENLDQAFAELEAECTDIVRGLTVFLWNSILIKTPQLYGGMAASWTYTYSPSNFKDRSGQVRPVELAAENLWRTDRYRVTRRGDPVATGIANAASAGKDREFRLGRTVYLTNGVDHGEGLYAGTVEAWDDSKLRSVNRPGRPVSRSLDLVQSRFGGDISKRYAELLKGLTIGGSLAASDS